MYNPDSLTPYKTMPEWTAKTLPKGFQKKHNTKVGTWAKLSIVSGQLKYFALDNAGEITDTYVFDKDSEIPFIEPQVWHKVAPLTDDLRCQLTFYCRAKDFYQKKYKLSATHSEVIEAVQIMYKDGLQFNGLTALDLGCGSGRNALFLQANGFSVNAYDKNSASIDKLNDIIEQENLDCLYATTVDLHQLDELANEFALTQYHLVVSTVVLMFLDKEKVASVIDAMQQHTKTGGYNVIVCAFCGALVSLILFLSDDMVLRSATNWLSGSLAEAGFVPLRYAVAAMLIGLLIILPLGRRLDALLLGETTALTMGVNVKLTRIWVIIACALLTGGAVSISGMIGFIGMMVPNLLAIIFGGSRTRLMLWSGWLGAIIMLIIDSAARHIAYPIDVPIGIVLALIGGPFFIWIFLQGSRR